MTWGAYIKKATRRNEQHVRLSQLINAILKYAITNSTSTCRPFKDGQHPEAVVRDEFFGLCQSLLVLRSTTQDAAIDDSHEGYQQVIMLLYVTNIGNIWVC
jgi:hypothetical protein